VWAADPDGGTVGTIAGAAAQASYAFDTVLGEGVSNAEVRRVACSHGLTTVAAPDVRRQACCMALLPLLFTLAGDLQPPARSPHPMTRPASL